MQLLLVGVSHRTAPVELRERLDFSAGGVDRALAALAGSPTHHEATIVSTCNRVELYVGCDESRRRRARPSSSSSPSFTAFPPISSAPHLYAKTGHDAVTHLFRVAAGLDSLVMGEPQVLGQVKDAFSVASQMGCTGPLLNKLFHSAFAAGKRVRSETALVRRRGVGQLRGGRAGAKDFRQPERPHGAGRRRRRDGQAHRHPHAVAGHRPAHHHEPHAPLMPQRWRESIGGTADAVGVAQHGARRSRHSDHRDRREHADHLARARSRRR